MVRKQQHEGSLGGVALIGILILVVGYINLHVIKLHRTKHTQSQVQVTLINSQ